MSPRLPPCLLGLVLLFCAATPLTAGEPVHGTWLGGRGDAASRGVSSLRLGWTRPPEIVGRVPLGIDTPIDARQVLSVAGRGIDDVLFVNDGGAVAAYATDGQRLWKTDGLGTGELLDAADLDGDGRTELLFSSLQRLELDYNAATGPGRLYILDAHSGDVLWRHQLTGLEFGFNRRRTTVASLDGGRTRSVLGVMTYSPSLWRLDYTRAGGGVITWRSQPFAYTSPEAAPRVVDLDGNGAPEVLIDAFGCLYVVDAATGRITASRPYVTHHTFGGFIDVALTPRGPLVVAVSNSVYGRTVAAFRYGTGEGLIPLWTRTWDAGLDSSTTELNVMPGLGRVGDRTVAAWSAAPAGTAPAAHVVDAFDVETGQPLASAPLGRLVDVLSTPGGTPLLVTEGAGGVRFTALSAAGFATVHAQPGARWMPVGRHRPPSETGNTGSHQPMAAQRGGPFAAAGLLASADDVLTPVRPWAATPFAQPSLRLDGARPASGLAMLTQDDLVVAHGADVYAVGAGAATRLFAGARTIWATPLAGQLDGDAGLEVVVPYRAGLGRLDFVARHAATVTPLIAATPTQRPETLYLPIIVPGATPGAATIVGFEATSDGLIELVGRGVNGAGRWRLALDLTGGEHAITRAAGDAPVVFQHDSHGTRAIDVRDGTVLWHAAHVGQCQRQMASADWNGDGVADVAVQAGDRTLVLDGRTGHALVDRYLFGPYGAYSSLARNAMGELVLAQVNGGGIGVLTSRGVVRDDLVELRGLEMLAPVVAPYGPDGDDHVFFATGTGVLTIAALDGSTVARLDTGLRVLTMTGAYVDDDTTVDMLISTYDGQLVAWSGRSRTELWRIGLAGLGGPAIATDVDGDGVGELIVTSGSGHLLVVAPRLAASATPADPTSDADADGIANGDEQRFGLDPRVADGELDADGDGVSNRDEIAAGTHPRGLWTAYLPGGVTSDFFDTVIAVANPSMDEPARVLVRLHDSAGRTTSRFVQIAPHSRWTLDVRKQVPEFADAEFGATVESDLPVATDGTQRWGRPAYGSATERGMTGGPSPTWYLAEGATHSGFDLFYMIQNPGARDADIQVRFLRPAGQPPVIWRGVVEAGRRFTLHVNRLVGLESAEVSGVVTSLNGVPVVVQRSMFQTSSARPFEAGSESAALRAPAPHWYLAEGATGAYFDTFVLIANPADTAAEVAVTYLRPAAAPIVHRHVIAAGSRFTIWLDHADPLLADTAVSTIVDSTNGVGVVVERAMWWAGASRLEGHGSPGATEVGTRWAVADGEAGGDDKAETYLLIANVADTWGSARVTLLFEDGTTSTRDFVLPPSSRVNVSVLDEFPTSEGKRFGAVIDSLGAAPVPVVVERAVYADSPGQRWTLGTAALATRIR